MSDHRLAPSTLIAALDARAQHRRQSHGGVVVHWREWGHGPPLVLLHGGHGTWLHWVHNIGHWSQRFRVIVPDLPGFGDSQDFALAAHDPVRLECLLQVLQQGIETLVPHGGLHVAGFSFGGAIAGLLAPRLHRLSRLVLLGTAGHGGTRRQREPLHDWRLDDGVAREAALRQNLAAFMLSGADAVDALALCIHERACMATRFRSKAISRNGQLPSALRHLARPVLMVWGEADVTAVPTEAAELLAQGREERAWIVLPKAGHWVQYESADAVNTLVTSWLLQAP